MTACLYSDYEHHCTVQFLVAITPDGALSWISPTYDGPTSDTFIAQDSGFLDLLKPGDQVTADQGFKIKRFSNETMYIRYSSKCS